jgi:hypothetical protein
MQDIERAPRGRWERIFSWASVGTLFPTLVVGDLLEGLGLSWWERIGVVALLIGGTTYLLSRPASAERALRLDADLRNGILDCALRFPRSVPGSLGDLWDPGVARVEELTLTFQTRLGDAAGSPAGRVRTFTGAGLAGETFDPPARRPQGLGRGWTLVHVQTDSGLLQVAATRRGAAYLEDRLPPAPAGDRAHHPDILG